MKPLDIESGLVVAGGWRLCDHQHMILKTEARKKSSSSWNYIALGVASTFVAGVFFAASTGPGAGGLESDKGVALAAASAFAVVGAMCLLIGCIAEGIRLAKSTE